MKAQAISRALTGTSPAQQRLPTMKLRLYVAGDAPNSALALSNLQAICSAYLAGSYDLQIINVLVHPLRSRLDGIRMSPTLVKLAPGPITHIVGTLSEPRHVLRALGFTGKIS